MSEHTPDTASIRSDYIRGTAADFIATEGKRCPCGEAHGVKSETARVALVWDAETRAVAGPEFDRWLAGIIRDAKVEALRDAAGYLALSHHCGEMRMGPAETIAWLRDMADRMEADDE